MIHLSTLPQEVTEEEIVNLLEEHGTIVNSKVFEMNGKKQALVQFETEEQATEALVCKHASSLSGSVIRISFSQLQNIWDFVKHLRTTRVTIVKHSSDKDSEFGKDILFMQLMVIFIILCFAC